jgi:hypothetical protein
MYQFSQRFDTEFPGDLAPVQFDGVLRDIQLSRNLLVQHPPDEVVINLALLWG